MDRSCGRSCRCRVHHTLNEGRDRSPGDTFPTDLVQRFVRGAVIGALNEGRDRSPGDTLTRYSASLRCHVVALNEGRDRSPGDTPDPGTASSFVSLIVPLNEGRDRSPGDTTW